jgi:glycerol-3-phosphate dehydrogenase
VALEQEIDFILSTAALYLARQPSRGDILSVFAGIRPLVKSAAGSTASLSRDHTIHIEKSGLLTICGGKWTTYRRMAEDCVNQAAVLARLPEKACATGNLRLHGFHESAEEFGALRGYGSDAPRIQELMRAEAALAEPLDSALPYTGAEVVWAARHEMARTVEDVLARRTRALFLNAKAAIRMAPRVALLMARELDRDGGWQDRQVAGFEKLARNYCPRLDAENLV